MDAERSWIIVSEANTFIWPGPDLRITPTGPHAVYGTLPPAIFRVIRERFLLRVTQRRAGLVPRT